MPASSRSMWRPALDAANQVRQDRAVLKREIRNSTITLADALEHPAAARMTVCDLWLCRPTWGLRRSARFFAALDPKDGIGPGKAVGSLTARQRAVLLEWARR